MIQYFLDFYRLLTTPERLIHLLSTVMTGWLGYSLLYGIVFAETGLLVGFVLPGDSLLFTVGVVAGAGHLDIVLVDVVLIAAAALGRACSAARSRAISAAITCCARRCSTKGTAAERSFMRASCRSSGRSRRSWPAWDRCRISASFR